MTPKQDDLLFDNADESRRLAALLRSWSGPATSLDVATGHLEIGGPLALDGAWGGTRPVRILMGDPNVSLRTAVAFERAVGRITAALDDSVEATKTADDFLSGVDEIARGLRSGRIQCRLYRQTRFHAKAYIVRGTPADGTRAVVGSSNFTAPGLSRNVELNVRVDDPTAAQVADWFDRYWADAEDVTATLLTVVDRHVRPYTPFDVYARSLHELFADVQQTATDWERNNSQVYRLLDGYQRDGYHQLVRIADRFGGAFLCDGVGLGKTFVGLMLIERLTVQEGKFVCLLVPKAARKPVWQAAIDRYLPRVSRQRLRIFNHTDLIRGVTADVDFPAEFRDVAEGFDAFVIDEAHHFRNPGLAGQGDRNPSRYRKLFEICGGKQMFLLTATPVNNRLIDLQHMIELFSRKDPGYFQSLEPTLGIHSLPGHFRKMEQDLKQTVAAATAGPADDGEPITDLVEAEQVLSDDRLFRRIVVQRSRGFVRDSQAREGGAKAIFPVRQPPRVAGYDLSGGHERLLVGLEKAFAHKKPLFSLAIYASLNYPVSGQGTVEPDAGTAEVFRGATAGRQGQIVRLIRIAFLKRFESSAEAFGQSCRLLLLKLLAFAEVHSGTTTEKRWLAQFKTRHAEIVGRVEVDRNLFNLDEEPAEDLVPQEMMEDAWDNKLDRKVYDVPKMLGETQTDLDTVADFLKELAHFGPAHDHKLQELIRLLTTDPDLADRKVLIFTEFTATARYLADQLNEAGLTGLAQIDGSTAGDRGDVIRQFAPYYNGTTSAGLATEKLPETRILISTDVLSEGLNLQDATRLINYDLHWNPVRLMQRIGRVDRRLSGETEAALVADHPAEAAVRGTVIYWNFLPPTALNRLLSLYATVTHKTLRISKTFGIEGRQLLTPDDDYDALKEFNEEYDGTQTAGERLQGEYKDLLRDHPGLAAAVAAMPNRVFSGRAHPTPGVRAVFFCYRLPGPPPKAVVRSTAADVAPLFHAAPPPPEPPPWTEAAGETRWYLYDLNTGLIAESPPDIATVIRSDPSTPRQTDLPRETLSDTRAKVEKHIRNTYLKSAGAPGHVAPTLKAWMELN